MKRSIHGAEVGYRQHRWRFEIVRQPLPVHDLQPVLVIRQRIHAAFDPEAEETLVIHRKVLPAFISHLRQALLELCETPLEGEEQRS